MLFKRTAALLELVFGFLGVIGCMAGIFAVWLLGSNLQQANEKVFAVLDKGLAAAQDRVRAVQMRVQEAKITTNEVAEKLRDWTLMKTKERFVSQLEIETHAGKLVGHLQTADAWLETATESIRGVQQVLVLGDLLGAPVDPASLQDVVENLEDARSTLQRAEQSVDGVRKFATAKDGEPEENRVSRAVKLLARTLLTIGEVDTRLDASTTRLSELQTSARQLMKRTSTTIILTTIVGYLLLAWIAAGQISLCLCGWRRL
jgi:hypothetical protein